ncbi:response regulator [Aliihoeflea aestuarii]|jgi:two-component SAPR family response regulator|uniref:response regulator n=1 Tax=Aliihoeflea aestuarii TaxID=453840 RepID=UPI00209414AB|nr:response regulator [Aliihoeflea aestuarii]MCO6392222.1 response regulator [Aliihoeflea aestuarii]
MPDVSGKLQGLNVFVVEDEALVALNLEDMLDELGCTVIGPAMRLGRAKEMLDGAFTADVAILDVNIAGEPVFPIAEQLAVRGIPIVFATGYGQAGLPTSWHSNPVLQKPYTMDEVSGSLAKALGGG